MSCVKSLFLAYLRPKESLLANTRLFFGVEQKTLTENHRCRECGKALMICFLQKATTPVRNRNCRLLVETNFHRIYADPSLSAIVRIFGIHGISLYAYDVICVFVQIERMLHLLAIGCRIVHAYEIQLLSFGSVAVFYTVLEQS